RRGARVCVHLRPLTKTRTGCCDPLSACEGRNTGLRRRTRVDQPRRPRSVRWPRFWLTLERWAPVLFHGTLTTACCRRCCDESLGHVDNWDRDCGAPRLLA